MGLFFLKLKTVAKALLLPPAGPLLLALAGIGMSRRRPALGRAVALAAVASLWLLCTPLVADAITRLAEHFPAIDMNRAARAQAIVILGGGGQRELAPEYQGAAAEPLLLERLAYGAYLAQRTGLPVLVTGWQIEAEAMRATLQRNFAVQARWVDARAYDTFENARNSVRLLKADGIGSIILVTRATHMWRSVQEFTAAGIEVIPAPVGILATRDAGVLRYLPNPDALLRSYAAIYELLGLPVQAFLAASHLRTQR